MIVAAVLFSSLLPSIVEDEVPGVLTDPSVIMQVHVTMLLLGAYAPTSSEPAPIDVNWIMRSDYAEVTLTNRAHLYVLARSDRDAYTWRVSLGRSLDPIEKIPPLNGCVHAGPAVPSYVLLAHGESLKLKYYFTSGDNIFTSWNRLPKSLDVKSRNDSLFLIRGDGVYDHMSFEASTPLPAKNFLRAIRMGRFEALRRIEEEFASGVRRRMPLE